MSSPTPTRSHLLALREERLAMGEGYAFLDEKCLLLAGAILAELRRHEALATALDAAQRAAATALHGALLHHGLDGLALYPPPVAPLVTLQVTSHSLLGIALRAAAAVPATAAVPAAAYPSAEAEACRQAFRALATAATALAACSGNLARLSDEYQRTVRRASALHDVVLPEIDSELRDIESRLEELEREEALGTHLRSPADHPHITSAAAAYSIRSMGDPPSAT